MSRHLFLRGLVLVLFVFPLGLVSSVFAQKAVHFTTVSYHIDRTPGGGTEPPNEFNPGLGLEWGLGTGTLYVGGYHNTVRELSLYAGYGRTAFRERPVRVGAVAGLVTGYPIIEVLPNVTVLPGIMPFVEVGRGPITPKLYAIPFRGGVLSLQLRVRMP